MALFLFPQFLIRDMDNTQVLGIILAILIGIIAAGLIIGAIVLGTRVRNSIGVDNRTREQR